MKSLVRKLLGSKIRRAPAGPRPPVRLGLEALEERAVPAQTLYWWGQSGNNWSIGSNWALSGPVAGAPGETWRAIDEALRRGHRGLPGDSSLSWLLAHHGRGG
jgi:hypothetical protein